MRFGNIRGPVTTLTHIAHPFLIQEGAPGCEPSERNELMKMPEEAAISMKRNGLGGNPK
jgi:hypothetical protein